MQSMTQQFKDWVAQQDPDREYDFFDPHHCAAITFLKSLGFEYGQGGRISDRYCFIAARTGDALTELPWTFGALSSRLEGVS